VRPDDITENFLQSECAEGRRGDERGSARVLLEGNKQLLPVGAQIGDFHERDPLIMFAAIKGYIYYL
jgi:hypothetical protein